MCRMTRSGAEKMGSVLPVRRLQIDQADVGFVNQCGTLQCVIGSFAVQVSPGDSAQFIVNQGDQSFACVWITMAPVNNKFTYPRRRRFCAHLSLPRCPAVVWTKDYSTTL
jgi:hypothetical protein